MKLTNTAVRAAKPADKPYKLADGGGLYLEVFPNGSKLWRLKYRRTGGRETRVSLGAYPSVTLAEARTEREQLKRQRRQGVDPAIQRKMQKVQQRTAAANSFEAVAREWLEKRAKKVTPDYLAKLKSRFDRDLFPYLGKRPIAEIEAQELLATLQRIEARGAIETAHRARGDCGALLRYAIATGRAKYDIAAALRGALTPHQAEHFPTITNPSEIGALLRATDGYRGTPEVRSALKLAPLTFVRPGELRHAEWAEFDLDGAEWRLPPEKMKMRAVWTAPPP
jgi:integrase